MKKRGMNERIQKLREESVSIEPRIYMERAELITDAYLKYEGSVSIPELRALSFKHFMENKTICINDGELIVGEKGDAPQKAPTFPELCCHTLEDMKIMNERELIGFKVNEEDFKLQEEKIIPYWEKRSIREKIINSMTDEWRACYGAGIFTEFMEQRGPGHTVGSSAIYENGFLDYINEIDEAIENLDFLKDKEALERQEQLKGMRIACEAIIALGKRYEDLAREMASKEEDEVRKAELLQIAENCKVVPANKPETYWQAIQMYWFVHLGVTTELNPWDAFSPGRLDQHLYPFYKEDVKVGSLDDDRALELLQSLWIKFNNQPAPPKVGVTLKESSTYTDFANINSGGITADGQDGVNEISYMILFQIIDINIKVLMFKYLEKLHKHF